MSGMILACIFGFGWLPLYLFRAESVLDALPFYSRGERLAVWFSLFAVSGHVTVTCTLLSLTMVVPPSRAAPSMIVFAAGIGWWLWGRVLIGPLRSTRLPHQPPLRLRQDGAFGLVRHPLYLGVLVAAAGPLVAMSTLLTGVTYVLCAMSVVIRVCQEDLRLRVQLGDVYDGYSRAVKRLIPFVW